MRINRKANENAGQNTAAFYVLFILKEALKHCWLDTYHFQNILTVYYCA